MALVTFRVLDGADRGRMFENVPDFDEDGNVTHRWAQPRLFGDDDWHACIDQTVRIGESICRKANALTIRANAERNLGRQIPFPWLVDENAAGI